MTDRIPRRSSIDERSTVRLLAVVVTVVTGVDIVVKALRMRQTSERSAMKRARRAAARQERAGRQERASR